MYNSYELHEQGAEPVVMNELQLGMKWLLIELSFDKFIQNQYFEFFYGF